MLRRRYSKSLALAILAPAFSAPLAIAEDAASPAASAQLVSTVVQDEPLKMPKDMTAMISRADRRVRFELVKLSGVEGQMLAGTSVTLIDSMGQTQNAVADANGTAVVDNVEPGAHAVVIGSESGHLALPLIVRSDDSGKPAEPSTVKLPLVSISPEEAIAGARAALPAQGTTQLDDIDLDYVSTGAISDAYNFRFRLSGSGELAGQVLTLVRKGVISSSVAGTQVTIYRDGVAVAQATADAQGRFQVAGLGEGTFGLTAVGPGGYAAFGFETYTAQSVARRLDADGVTLVSTAAQPVAPGDVLPVMLIPPAMVEPMLVSLEQSYAGAFGGAGMGPMAAMAPAGALGGIGAGANGFAGGAGAGGGGAAGAAGGLGGLGALAAVAAVPAAIAAGNNNNNNDQPGINASPAVVP